VSLSCASRPDEVGRGLFPFFAAAFTAAFYAGLNFPEFVTGIDSLRQLEGALHIYLGEGYIQNSGNHIVYWPPTYAYLVAGSMALFGPTYLAIIAVNSLILAATCAGWIYLARKLSRNYDNRNPYIDILVNVTICFWIIYQLRSPASQALFYLVCPFYILSFINFIGSGSSLAKWMCVHSLLSILIANSHNIGAMFMGACSIAIFLTWVLSAKNVREILPVVFTSTIGTASWLFVRHEFNLSGSHPFSLFSADLSFFEAIMQFVVGISRMNIFYVPLGMLVLFLMITLITRLLINRNSDALFRQEMFLTLCVMFHFLLMTIIFSSTFQNSGLQGRFALVLNLLLLCLLSVSVTRKSHGKEHVVGVVCLVLIFSSTSLRVAKLAAERFVWDRPLAYHIDSKSEISEVSLKALYDSGGRNGV